MPIYNLPAPPYVEPPDIGKAFDALAQSRDVDAKDAQNVFKTLLSGLDAKTATALIPYLLEEPTISSAQDPKQQPFTGPKKYKPSMKPGTPGFKPLEELSPEERAKYQSPRKTVEEGFRRAMGRMQTEAPEAGVDPTEWRLWWSNVQQNAREANVQVSAEEVQRLTSVLVKGQAPSTENTGIEQSRIDKILYSAPVKNLQAEEAFIAQRKAEYETKGMPWTSADALQAHTDFWRAPKEELLQLQADNAILDLENKGLQIKNLDLSLQRTLDAMQKGVEADPKDIANAEKAKGESAPMIPILERAAQAFEKAVAGDRQAQDIVRQMVKSALIAQGRNVSGAYIYLIEQLRTPSGFTDSNAALMNTLLEMERSKFARADNILRSRRIPHAPGYPQYEGTGAAPDSTQRSDSIMEAIEKWDKQFSLE